MKNFYVIVTRDRSIIALPAPELEPGADEIAAAAVHFFDKRTAIVRVEAVSEEAAIDDALTDLDQHDWFYVIPAREPVQRKKMDSIHTVRVNKPKKRMSFAQGCAIAFGLTVAGNILAWAVTGMFLWEYVLLWLFT